MKIGFTFIFLIITVSSSVSQVNKKDSVQELHSKALFHIEKALSYLQDAQQKENDSIFSFKGEWPSHMSMNFWFPLLGGERSAYDSNCFSVATVHNILAEAFLQYPEYKEILPMLDLAFERIMKYESEGTFNFWNLLPPTEPLRWFERETSELVRRPNNYPLPIKFMQKAANVSNDADDTAAALLAIYLRNKIKGNQIPDSLQDIHQIFDQYTDSNRNNRLWYNFWQKQGPESGAYLTWLGEEYEFQKSWSPVQELFHLGTFYLPFSKMFPHAYQTYIPYGSNDLDVVVNANILRVLSVYNNGKSISENDAINFIEAEITDKNYDYAATYYPNRYHIPYYVSKAFNSGVSDLNKSCKSIEKDILHKFYNDKNWTSRPIINKGDSLQSTALAVNALLNISGIHSEESADAILSGLNLIFSKKIETDAGIYWEGGIFFSGGTVVRHVLHWKSDAVTTALIVEALVTLRHQLEVKYPFLETQSFAKSSTK